MNKKGGEGSLCKTFHPKCFKTTNFDRYHVQGIVLEMFSNSNYAMDNALAVISIGGFSVVISTYAETLIFPVKKRC